MQYNTLDEWVNDEMIPFFVKITQQALKRKPFVYDFKLAESARKHSEYMALNGRVQCSPREYREGAEENTFCCIASGGDVKMALSWIANTFRQDTKDSRKLKECDIIGVGIALRGNEIYVTQRLRRIPFI